jgi:hypothetical protein
MLAPEDLPATHARVLKVVPTSSSTPAQQGPPPPTVEQKVAKFEDDYMSSDDTTSGTGTTADVKEEEDGWNVVTSRAKSELAFFWFRRGRKLTWYRTGIPEPRCNCCLVIYL